MCIYCKKLDQKRGKFKKVNDICLQQLEEQVCKCQVELTPLFPCPAAPGPAAVGQATAFTLAMPTLVWCVQVRGSCVAVIQGF